MTSIDQSFDYSLTTADRQHSYANHVSILLHNIMGRSGIYRVLTLIKLNAVEIAGLT